MCRKTPHRDSFKVGLAVYGPGSSSSAPATYPSGKRDERFGSFLPWTPSAGASSYANFNLTISENIDSETFPILVRQNSVV